MEWKEIATPENQAFGIQSIRLLIEEYELIINHPTIFRKF